MNPLSRRSFMGLLGTGALSAIAGWRPDWRAPEFRIRTITAGVELKSAADLEAVRAARDFLSLASSRFSDFFEVQTTRIATQPLPRYASSWMSAPALESVRELDRLAADADIMFNIGPVLTEDADVPGFASWAADLAASTTNTSFSAFMASAAQGIHHRSIQAAAEAIAAIAHGTPGGEGNFRFCATAFCPPGTPFFPAAYHEGPRAFSIGLESPRLLLAALEDTTTPAEAERSMRTRLNAALTPIEDLGERISGETGWRYLGIDTSPAPGLDSSIGRVIETLAGAPFGSPSTLAACSTITNVLKGLDAKTCGYSGLMLPVLEDQVLADRAVEGRYGVSELLLYSSVCGTGLDVVPLPGDVPDPALAASIGDVAALAARYQKSLSARLFPIPGKREGEMVEFDNPFLTRCVVMALG
jgi:uncharacterized protein (UPF0210 family)